MFKMRFLVMFVVTVFLCVPAHALTAQGELHLTLGDPIESEMGELGKAFKEYVERESLGSMKVELASAGGSLGEDESLQFHRVQLGRLDMAFGGVANLEPMVNALGLLTLPYLFTSEEDVVRATSGEAARLLNTHAEKAGLRILAWTYCGFRNISNSKRPITRLQDMQGLHFRVPQSFVMLETYRALGATPSPIDWNMTRNALMNHEVDGQCYDHTGFLAMRFHEAGQRYISELHYLYLLQPLVISLQVFNQMSPNMQDILLRAGHYVQELSLRYQQEERPKAREALQKAGVQIDALSDEPVWRQVVREKVWPRVVNHIGGKEVINAYLAAAGLPLWE